MHENPYSMGLAKNAANFVALSPVSFLERAARVHPQRVALVYGDLRQSWADTYERCRRFAAALSARGIGHGDTVAVMLPNTPAMFEAHFGVPMNGAVLNTLNTRLDAPAIAFMLQHGEAKVLLMDREFSAVIAQALSIMEGPRPTVIEVEDETLRTFDGILKYGTANNNQYSKRRYANHGLVYGDYYLVAFGNRLLQMGLA